MVRGKLAKILFGADKLCKTAPFIGQENEMKKPLLHDFFKKCKISILVYFIIVFKRKGHIKAL